MGSSGVAADVYCGLFEDCAKILVRSLSILVAAGLGSGDLIGGLVAINVVYGRGTGASAKKPLLRFLVT